MNNFYHTWRRTFNWSFQKRVFRRTLTPKYAGFVLATGTMMHIIADYRSYIQYTTVGDFIWTKDAEKVLIKFRASDPDIEKNANKTLDILRLYAEQEGIAVKFDDNANVSYYMRSGVILQTPEFITFTRGVMINLNRLESTLHHEDRHRQQHKWTRPLDILHPYIFSYFVWMNPINVGIFLIFPMFYLLDHVKISYLEYDAARYEIKSQTTKCLEKRLEVWRESIDNDTWTQYFTDPHPQMKSYVRWAEDELASRCASK